MNVLRLEPRQAKGVRAGDVKARPSLMRDNTTSVDNSQETFATILIGRTEPTDVSFRRTNAIKQHIKRHCEERDEAGSMSLSLPSMSVEQIAE